MAYEPHPWSTEKAQLADDLQADGNLNDASYIREDVGELDKMYEFRQRGTQDYNTIRGWCAQMQSDLQGSRPTSEITQEAQSRLDGFTLTPTYQPPTTRAYTWQYEEVRDAPKQDTK